MSRNITLSFGSQYKNGDIQKTGTLLAYKLNKGVKLEDVFGDLIGVRNSDEFIEHDDNGDLIGYSLKEQWYDENSRAGVVLTSANKLTYFENVYRGNSKNLSSVPAIPLSEKGVANGVATLGPDGIVPKSQLEIVSIDLATGTIKTSDGNTDATSVANWSYLNTKPKLVDNDRIYFADPAVPNGQNKVISYGEIKAQLKDEILTKCFKLSSKNLTPNTVIKFPHTFGTIDLSSVTVYDANNYVITNETNIDTHITATDIEVKSTVNVPGAYVIVCGLENSNGPITPPPTGALTVEMTATGYKVKTTVNGVVSNEIELPCPIVGELLLPDVVKKKADFSVGQFGFELGNNNASFVLNTPNLPIAPSGYNWYIDIKFRCTVNDRTQVYPNSKSRLRLRTFGYGFDDFSDTVYDNQVSVNQETGATNFVNGGKLSGGINTITTLTIYEVSAQQATPNQDYCGITRAQYTYKIYLAKSI
jgi:hypothetical protein